MPSACGPPDASTVSVQVAADGGVGPVVRLAGTRSSARSADLPVAISAVLVLLTAGTAALGLGAGAGVPPRAGRQRRGSGLGSSG